MDEIEKLRKQLKESEDALRDKLDGDTRQKSKKHLANNAARKFPKYPNHYPTDSSSDEEESQVPPKKTKLEQRNVFNAR